MAIDKLKNKFFAGSFITDVKHYFSKINEIIDWINNIGTSLGIGGSGTTNYVSKFTASGTIGNSQIFDNGTTVRINNNTNYGYSEVFSIKGHSVLTNDAQNFTDLAFLNNSTFAGRIRYYTDRLEQNAARYAFLDNSSVTMLDINGYGAKESSFKYNVGIGGNFNPTARLQVQGVDATSSNYSLKITDSATNNLLSIRNDGVVIANNLPTSAAGLPAGAIWRNGNVLNIV